MGDSRTRHIDPAERTLHNLHLAVKRLTALEEFHQAYPIAYWARWLFLTVGSGAIGGALFVLLFHKWLVFPEDGIVSATTIGAGIGLLYGVVTGVLDPLGDVKNGIIGCGMGGLMLGAISGLVTGCISPSSPIAWMIVGAFLGGAQLDATSMGRSLSAVSILVAVAAGGGAAWGLFTSHSWIQGAIAGGAFGFGLLVFAVLGPWRTAAEERLPKDDDKRMPAKATESNGPKAGDTAQTLD